MGGRIGAGGESDPSGGLMRFGRAVLGGGALACAALAASCGTALAHIGLGAQGFLPGAAHPFSGFDHLLAMCAVGLFAAQLGGRARWLVPAGFVVAVAVGAALGAASVPVGPVESGIALSLVAFGLALATAWRWPAVAATLFVGLFGLFHGHAHGADIPADAHGLAYGAGVLLATATLHALGVGAGQIAGARPALRLAGAGIASAGAALLIGA